MSSSVNQSVFQFLFPYNSSPLLPEYAESQKVNYVLFPKMHSFLIVLQQSSALSHSVQFKRITTSQTQASDTLRNLKGIIEVVVKTVDLKTLFPDFKFQL